MSTSPPASTTNNSNNTSPSTDRLLIPKLIINYYLLISSILFIVPTSLADTNFFHALICAVSINIISLFQRHGIPKFSIDYLRLLITDERLYNAGHALIMILSLPKPFMLILVPHAIRSLIYVCRYSEPYLQYIPYVLQYLSQYIAQVRNMEGTLLIYGAVFEVYCGFALIMMLFVGGSSFITIILYWQYLQGKYSVSNNCRLAFSQIKLMLNSIFYHQYCPSVITNGFEWIVKKMWESTQIAPRPAAA